MHYDNLTDAQETPNIFKSEPITCKLADLLEARVISNNSCTHFVRHGNPDYMAPEILVKESVLKLAGIEQLKAIDVWGLSWLFRHLES